MYYREAGDKNKKRNYLPDDKQYLVTKNVPCRTRVASLDQNYKAETEIEQDDEGGSWLATHVSNKTSADEVTELEDISREIESKPVAHVNILGAVVDEHFTQGSDEYADMSNFEEDNLVEDAATLYVTAEEPDNDETLIKTRTYDLCITYDKYYQTPRVWLFGYDEEQQPLTHVQMFQDIMQDYANRTVTIETHPHLDVAYASIHPCQHSAVMKRIVDNLKGGGAEARNDQYLFIFLKFIQSVIPTIDYDYTMEIQGKSS